MMIYELTADRIKDTAAASGADFNELLQLYHDAEDRNCRCFVRTERDWLQYVFVENPLGFDPDVLRSLKNHSMWSSGRLWSSTDLQGGDNLVA